MKCHLCSLSLLRRKSQKKDVDELAKLGGVEGLARKLDADLKNGLSLRAGDAASRTARVEAFGSNIFEEAPPTSFFSILWEALQVRPLSPARAPRRCCLAGDGRGAAGPLSFQCCPSFSRSSAPLFAP